MKKYQSKIFDPKKYLQVRRGKVPKESIEHPMLVFDVVGFSTKMVNEKMIKIIEDIHTVISDELEPNFYWAEKKGHSGKNDLLLIPTGDGYGIALSPVHDDEVILEIASGLYRNFKALKISVRMGIARGRNIVTFDSNDNLNLFGYGIVLATRVCNAAAEGQILVHAEFAQSLSQKKELPALQKIDGVFGAKHDLSFVCYNYYAENEFGIKQP